MSYPIVVEVAMKTFKDTHFLITGGASGIGLATAQHLHDAGASVTLWDSNETLLSRVGTEMGVQTAVVDVTDYEQVSGGVASLAPLHGVVHAAGILRTDRFDEQAVEAQLAMVNVNLMGSVHVAQAVIPLLKQSQGSLIFMASTAAFYGPPEFLVYGATKAAVLNLAQGLRLELERDGVHIGAVCPFFTNTPMLDEGLETTLFDRFGTTHQADDVARAIVRGIRRRTFMIWPSINPAFFYWLSHVAYPFNHRIMKLFWR